MALTIRVLAASWSSEIKQLKGREFRKEQSPCMHFRPQRALASLHSLDLLDLIAQTRDGKDAKTLKDIQRRVRGLIVSLGLFCSFTQHNAAEEQPERTD